MQLSTIAGSAFLLALLLLNLSLLTTAAPYQELAPRQGFVPVYIRTGDEPLSDIHPSLAEAFDETNATQLKSENLVTELPESTAQPQEKASTEATTTTESDIASFDVIKSGA